MPENYGKKLKEYKEKQADILNQMKDHSEADYEFHLTANMVFNLANRAVDIFDSSEPQKKTAIPQFPISELYLKWQKVEF